MRRRPASLVRLVFAAALVVAAPRAAALDSAEPRRLAETHFHQLYGFDALEAYDARVGPATTAFAIARRWKDGRAQVVVDIRKPPAYSKWALLLLQNPDRSDDLFVYVPDIGGPAARRVRRLSAPQMEREIVFDLLPLGDLRPIAPGELEYTRLADAEVEGETCTLIEGRPLYRGREFDRLELALSRASGFSLRTRYFKGAREIRRVLISPGDLHQFQGRQLPARRRIVRDPEGPATELLLRNVMLDPVLPDRFFTHHNLRVQRFPSF